MWQGFTLYRLWHSEANRHLPRTNALSGVYMGNSLRKGLSPWVKLENESRARGRDSRLVFSPVASTRTPAVAQRDERTYSKQLSMSFFKRMEHHV